MTPITILAPPQQWLLSETIMSSKKYLKVPIAILGKWKHDVYGSVEFNQQDFNDIVQNFSEAKAGYDPPLFLGHPIATNAIEAAPSAGWPERVYQEDNVLYGLYTPTSDELYNDVRAQKYRYASAEVIRNAKDKESGERIGTLLVGTALTNRPFLPLRDHTVEAIEQKFSDFSTPTLFCFDLDPSSENTSMTDINEKTPPTPDVQSEQKLSEPQVTSPATTPAMQEDMVPKAQYDALAEEFSCLAKEFSTMKQQFSEIISKEKSRAVEAKLAKLNALNLPASTKQTFSDMITSGTLSQEAEDRLFSDYQALSDTYKHVFTAPQGTQESSTNKKEVELPQLYADIIESNKKLIEKKDPSLLPTVLY